jgi:hypothetical protein
MAKRISGGKVKGLAGLRKSIKRSSGDGAITRIPKDAPLVVRFAQEPDEWYEFFNHWDDTTKKSSICVSSDCEGCADGLKQTKRFLANAVDIDKSKMIAVELPVTLVSLLLKRLDKYHTLMDRDYELTKNGQGTDTEYDAISEGRSKFNLEMYELLDLGEVLAEQVADRDDADDEEEEVLPPPRSKSTSGTKRTGGSLRRAPRQRQAPDDEDEAEDVDPPFEGGKRIIKKAPAKGLPEKQPAKKALPAKSTGKTLGKTTARKPLRK